MFITLVERHFVRGCFLWRADEEETTIKDGIGRRRGREGGGTAKRRSLNFFVDTANEEAKETKRGGENEIATRAL